MLTAVLGAMASPAPVPPLTLTFIAAAYDSQTNTTAPAHQAGDLLFGYLKYDGSLTGWTDLGPIYTGYPLSHICYFIATDASTKTLVGSSYGSAIAVFRPNTPITSVVAGTRCDFATGGITGVATGTGTAGQNIVFSGGQALNGGLALTMTCGIEQADNDGTFYWAWGINKNLSSSVTVTTGGPPANYYDGPSYSGLIQVNVS